MINEKSDLDASWKVGRVDGKDLETAGKLGIGTLIGT